MEKAYGMTFDELMDAACESAALSNMARTLLPSALIGEKKKAIMKPEPEVFGWILKDVTGQIDNGSVESVDVLVG